MYNQAVTITLLLVTKMLNVHILYIVVRNTITTIMSINVTSQCVYLSSTRMNHYNNLISPAQWKK